MIKVSVFSEEKAWSKRLKNSDIFFKKICRAFPKKYQFSNKEQVELIKYCIAISSFLKDIFNNPRL